MLFQGGVAGDLNAALCIASFSDDLFYLLEKACFVGEIVCNTQNTENSEQVRWYT